MSDGVERQIFADAAKPDPDIPDHAVDSAVSDAITALQRDPDRGPPPPPAGRRPAEPDQLDGIDDRSSSGILKALLDERDRRQQATARADRLEQMERERAQRENRPPVNERLFTNPEATLDELREEWIRPLKQEIADIRLNSDFNVAYARHGESFTEAWNTWYEAVKDGKDAQSYWQVMNTTSPGEAVVHWYKRQQIVGEVGDDLEAYRQRVIDDYLRGGTTSSPQGDGRARDPETGQFTARPQAPPRRMPTATSRLGSSGDPHGDDDEFNDGSDAAIFAAARPQKRRR